MIHYPLLHDSMEGVDNFSPVLNYKTRTYHACIVKRPSKNRVMSRNPHFSDASKEAIGYLNLLDHESCQTNSVLGKAKIATARGHTIPCLELLEQLETSCM